MPKAALPKRASLLAIDTIAASAVAALAQAPAPVRKGYAPVVLMNRDDVRILRVEIEVGGVRAVHKHDDVKFHLFIPVTGSIELTMGSDAPVAAPPGQAFYLAKGTMHGFRNTGTTPAAVIEVFVKQAAPAVAGSHSPLSPGVSALVAALTAGNLSAEPERP